LAEIGPPYGTLGPPSDRDPLRGLRSEDGSQPMELAAPLAPWVPGGFRTVFDRSRCRVFHAGCAPLSCV